MMLKLLEMSEICCIVQRLNPYNYLTHIIILNNYPILISENHQNKMYNLQIRPEQFTDKKEKAEITLHNWK